MPKLRKIASIERGIEEILQALTEQEIKETIGKGASYLRKCSDPDDKDHNLHLSDAIKIDILSLKSQNMINNWISFFHFTFASSPYEFY